MPPEQPTLVDAATAAAYVAHLRGKPCKPGTIWAWASRGHIQRHGRGRYDLHEIDAWTRRLLMDDMIGFLRARLDEAEQVARAATCGPWTAKRADQSVYAQETSVVMGGHDGGWYIVPFQEEGGEGIEPGDAEHIAHWDPDRALAEVEAKRRILDAHDRPHDCIAREASGGHSVVNGRPWEAWAPHHTADHGPCFVIRCLALPYAQHPDYRTEWHSVSDS
jgi:hypothetical protein